MPHRSDRPADWDPAHVPCDYMGRSVTPPGLLGTDTSSVFAHTLECIGMCALSPLPTPVFLTWMTGSIAAALVCRSSNFSNLGARMARSSFVLARDGRLVLSVMPLC